MKHPLKSLLTLGAMALVCAFSARGQYRRVEANPYGERPIIVPVPSSTEGVAVPVMTINNWYYKENADESVYSSHSIPSDFSKYKMERAVWGHRTPDGISAFMQEIEVPADFKGKRVIIRFNGTTHLTSLYINGRHVRDHWGSYGSWTADISDFVECGKKALVALRMDQRSIGLAAFVRFSGNIYEDTQLYAVPKHYIQRLRFSTDLDDNYKDASLDLWLKVNDISKGSVKVLLTDAEGRNIKSVPTVFQLPEDLDEFRYSISVPNPKKWDSEHPNLYKMSLSLTDAKGRVIETIQKNVGFREIERRGNKLYVNGQEVKFRGIWGVDSARKMRDLNVNHVRHKYMTESYLDSCDVYGIYVLHENSVDFAKFRNGEHPKYAGQWLDLLADMMERDYCHPSVVMWGLGNESFNGDFTLQTHKYAKFDDPQRQTMFSWANRISPDKEIPYDIYSFHYGSFSKPDFDPSKYGTALWHSTSLLNDRTDNPQMPVLFDESTHVVISQEEVRRDPNVRNFWGESIKYCWEKCWNTEGVLGLDQFGMFTDLSNWDMPEQWLMRKAYSPFVIKERSYPNPGKGKGLKIEVENRFCHTNLSETSILWSVDGHKGKIKGPDAKPHEHAVFEIPYYDFKDNDTLELAIQRADGYQVDEYRLSVGTEPFRLPALSKEAPKLAENDGYIIIKGKDYTLTYDTYAGQITSVDYKGERVITGGPHLQLLRSGLSIGEYWPQSSKAYIEGSEAVIDMDVIYSPIKAAFQVRIDNNGLMTVHYTIKHFPDPPPASTTIPWGSADEGGFSEVGIAFSLPGTVDRIQWDRLGLWTIYPGTHVGREKGIAYKKADGLNQKNWKNITYDFGWMGFTMNSTDVTNDFRASKEYIRTADVLLEGKTVGVEALSEEKDAVRLETRSRNSDTVTMYINNEWNYPTLGVGNYMKPPIVFGDGYKNTVHLRLFDSREEAKH